MSIDITFKHNFRSINSKLSEIARRFPETMDKGMFNAGQRISASVKRKTPKQSGKLSKSIQSRKTGDLKYTITSPLKYNEHVEFGVKPFRAKNKKALRIVDIGLRPFGNRQARPGTGKIIFRKSSKGFEGFFMYKKSEVGARIILGREMNKTLRRIALRIKSIK